MNSNPSGSNLLDSAQKKGSVTNTENFRGLIAASPARIWRDNIVSAIVDDELAVVLAAVFDGVGPNVLYHGFLAGNYRFISGNFRWMAYIEVPAILG